MESWADGVAAVTLFMEDLAAGKEFYQRVLGDLPVYEDEVSAAFRLAGTMVNLLATSAATELVAPAAVAPGAQGVRSVLTVEVDDVDRVCALLSERGVGLLNGPVDRPWGIRTASFADPTGHVWELAGPLVPDEGQA